MPNLKAAAKVYLGTSVVSKVNRGLVNVYSQIAAAVFGKATVSNLALWLDASQMTATALASDDFNRADNASSLGTSSSGHVWTALSGTWGISSNRAYNVDGGSQRGVVVDVANADMDVSATWATATGDPGIIFRAVDDSNYLLVTSTSLFKRVGGSFTTIGSAYSGINSGDVMRVVASGTSITVYKNGTSLVAVTDTTFQTATKCGLRTHAATTSRFDNFAVTTIGNPSGADGAAVSVWPDLSGNGRHATQATAANQPVLRSAPTGFNSKAAVQFDGTNDKIATANAAVTVGTAYIVAKVVGTVQFQGVLTNGTDQGAAGTADYAFTEYGATGTWDIDTGVGASLAQSCVNMSRDAVWGEVGMDRGNTHIFGAANSTAAIFPNGFLLGDDRGNNRFYNGLIAETLVYNRALTGPERWTVESYLGSKYGIALPAVVDSFDRATVVDSFTRADSASSLGGTEVGAKTWTAHSGTWGISSGQAYSSTTNSLASVDTGTADITASVTVSTTSGGGDEEFIYVRVTDTANWVRFGRSSTTYFLQKAVGGSVTNLGSGAMTLASGDVLTLTANGSSLTALCNGTQVATATDSAHSTVARAGIGLFGSTASRFDNFSVTPAASLSSLGVADSGQTWTALSGTWGVTGGQAYTPDTVDGRVAVIDVGSANMDVTATMTSGASLYPSINARVTDASNMYLLEAQTTANFALIKRVGGTNTVLGGFAGTYSAGNVVRLVTSGTSIATYVNGAAVHAVTDSSLTTGTKAGIRHGAAGAATGARFDNFSVRTL